MNYILLQKQESIFVFTKSINVYPNIEAQTSDETRPLENYENRIVVFNGMLLSKQESKSDLFFIRGSHKKLIFIIYLTATFISLKKQFPIILKYIFHFNKL